MRYSTLPQLAGGLFLSDGGLETTLVFLEGIELPHFAAFVLLTDGPGRERLRRYYRPYLEICAATPGAGFVLETPTWRANPAWARRLGYDEGALARANTDAVALTAELRDEWGPRLDAPIVLSGIIGPRGDSYVVGDAIDADAAEAYHAVQASQLAAAGVDMVAAVTMTGSAEAIGVARAARTLGVPAAISFTIETDGRLPSGEDLGDAIAAVDADAPPAYFALNCAHPSHFDRLVDASAPWLARVRGLRANASSKSHAELDASTELDIGDPPDLAGHYRRLRGALPKLSVLGGCCGTDIRHLLAIRDAWLN